MKFGATSFILLTLLLDAIGVGIVFPMMPDLMASVGADSTAAGSIRGGILMSAYAAMLFLCGPAMGSLSDRFGRRPVLLIALAALTFDYVLMAVAHSYALLLLGRILAGIAGSTYSTSTAYLSDISTPEEKAAKFGLIGAAFGIGFVIGPVIGGMAASVDVSLPFWIAAACTGAAVLVGYFILPESLPPEKRRPLDFSEFNPLKALWQIGRLPGLGWPLAILFVFEFANLVYPTLWAFWLREMFGWDARSIGLTLGLYGVGIAITQGMLLGQLVALIGEFRTLMIAMISGAIAMLAFGFIGQAWMIFLFLIPACLSDMAPPTLSAMAANKVDEDRQGLLQGVIMSLSAISAAIGPLFMTSMFSFFARTDGAIYWPGFPFFAGALLVLGLVPLLGRLRGAG